MKCIGFRTEKQIPIPIFRRNIMMMVVKESYDFDFSAIRGGSRMYTPTDECWCNTVNKCAPEQDCDDCNVDQSGLCNQSVIDSSVPGV